MIILLSLLLITYHIYDTDIDIVDLRAADILKWSINSLSVVEVSPRYNKDMSKLFKYVHLWFSVYLLSIWYLTMTEVGVSQVFKKSYDSKTS